MKTFNPTTAIPYIAANELFIPSPWSQDPSATDNTTVVADASITPDGSNINLKVQDGWRWIQLGNPSHVYSYARTEINLTNQIGYTVFPAGVVTTFEWQGYFTSALPAEVSGEPFTAPFQIHHKGDGSPPYGLEVDTSNHLLYLYIHNINGTFNRRELLGDFNDLVNVSTNIKANYKPNSAPGIADGSMQILINNVEVFSESGVENCVVQNHDYAKVGIYDFTNAIVDPSDAGRGQSLEMVVENFSVYLAATPTRTHIDTSQAGVPVGGTINQVLKKNSSTDFDYSWGAGGGSPAGSNTYVQYNDSGSFGGDANFTWDKTNQTLTAGNIFADKSTKTVYLGESTYSFSLVDESASDVSASQLILNRSSHSFNFSAQLQGPLSGGESYNFNCLVSQFDSATSFYGFKGISTSGVNILTFGFDLEGGTGSSRLTIDNDNETFTFNKPNITISSIPYIFPSTPPTVGQVLTCTDDTGGVYTLTWQ